MPIERLSRRRMLVTALAVGSIDGRTSPRRFEWRGTALGANARLVLAGGNREQAGAAVRTVLAEVDRLEREFSLYRPDSNLVRLNRDGSLSNPSPDWQALLRLAQRMHAATQGSFDISIQPLWAAIAGYFVEHPRALQVPDAIIDAVMKNVGMARVQIDESGVSLDSGMALTLNGVAQGYVCDRVADVLQSMGWANVLVNLGEIRASGHPKPGRDWTVETPGGRSVALAGGAVATSAGSAGYLGTSGKFHHLIDSRTGRSPARYASVTAIAETAAVADALSTAAFMATPDELGALARAFGGSIEAVTTDRHVIVAG